MEYLSQDPQETITNFFAEAALTHCTSCNYGSKIDEQHSSSQTTIRLLADRFHGCLISFGGHLVYAVLGTLEDSRIPPMIHALKELIV